MDSVRQLTKEVEELRKDADKNEEMRTREPDHQPSTSTPTVSTILLSLPSRSLPSSSGITPTRSRLQTINDPKYGNRNLQGGNIDGEPQIQASLGPRETEKDMRQRKEEGRALYQRRTQYEKQTLPKSQPAKRPWNNRDY